MSSSRKLKSQSAQKFGPYHQGKETPEDYKLIQYDQTVGKDYLKNLNFTQIS
jgi:hypothetical protein